MKKKVHTFRDKLNQPLVHRNNHKNIIMNIERVIVTVSNTVICKHLMQSPQFAKHIYL